MSQTAFAFLDRPTRSRKPRKTGITVGSDFGLSLAQARDIVETASDIIDHVKMPDHVGLLWRFDEDLIRRKNDIYLAAGIHTLPGGVPFEVAAVQGKVPQFMQRVAELGFKAVEVSEDSIDLGVGDRISAIKHGVAAGLQVFTEIGKKLPDNPLDPVEGSETALADLDAGAYMVVIEKSDVVLLMHSGGDALHQLVEQIGMERIIVECGPGDDRLQVARWLIEQFGPEINLENIDADETPVIEAMRHGLNRGVGYSYFQPYRGKALPPIAAP